MNFEVFMSVINDYLISMLHYLTTTYLDIIRDA